MRIAKDFHRPLAVGVLLGNLENAVGADRKEVARGMVNVEGSCGASSRLQGLSLGTADLATARGMMTTRVGGGHPGYLVCRDPVGGQVAGERPAYQQGLWHYTVARTVDGCVMHVQYPYGGPFDDVAHAWRVVNAKADGTAAVMLDGKMEDDASLKECRVIAERLACSDPAIAQLDADSSGGAPGSEASAPATTVPQNG